MTITSSPRVVTPLPSLRKADPEAVAYEELLVESEGSAASSAASGAGTEGARHNRKAGIYAEISLVIVSIVASLSVARLLHGGLGHDVILPLFACVLVGSAATIIASRTGLPILVVAAIGAVAAVLTTIWSVAPGSTWLGIPTTTTYHVLSNEITRARAVMGSNRTPVPSVPGVVAIASVSVGLVAVAARALWELTRRSLGRIPRLIALVPTFGMLCYSAPLSARLDRAQTSIFYFASALLFIATADAASETLRPAWVADSYIRARRTAASVLPTLAAAGAALLVMLLAAAALSGTVPVAFPWWDNPGPGNTVGTGSGHSSGATAESLIANLKALETSSKNIKMFTASSPITTYWQVGLLAVFDGTKWVPASSEADAEAGKFVQPPVSPDLPPIGQTEIASVSIESFSDRLLPTPPLSLAPATSSPDQAIEFSDSLGAVAVEPITSGKTYQVIFQPAVVPPLSDASSISLPSIYAGLEGNESTYLSLPANIPGQIQQIANSIVGSNTNPLVEVQLLVNYFHNGTFSYSLAPPPIPKGQNALLDFLTTQKIGFCQQFAGAFGVLARELGIPVRLAVGFTPGVPVKGQPDEYEVTGIDAHVWPEVYLGPQFGWVSVDPTPGPNIGEQTAKDVVGVRTVHLPKGHGKTAPTTATTGVGKSKPPLPKTRTTGSASTGNNAKHTTPLPAGLILAGVIALMAVVVGLVYFRRSKRSVRRGLLIGRNLSSDPDHVILRAWMRACTALGRAGFQRAQWTTPAAHAAQVRAAIVEGGAAKRAFGVSTGAAAASATGSAALSGSGRRSRRAERRERDVDATAALGAATYGYTELAELAELACYCPGKCTSRDARHAEQEAWRIERSLRTSGMYRRFLSPPAPPHTGAWAT